MQSPGKVPAPIPVLVRVSEDGSLTLVSAGLRRRPGRNLVAEADPRLYVVANAGSGVFSEYTIGEARRPQAPNGRGRNPWCDRDGVKQPRSLRSEWRQWLSKGLRGRGRWNTHANVPDGASQEGMAATWNLHPGPLRRAKSRHRRRRRNRPPFSFWR